MDTNKCEKSGFHHYWKGYIIPQAYEIYYSDYNTSRYLIERCENCGALRRKYETYKILYNPPKDWLGNDKYWDNLPYIDSE